MKNKIEDLRDHLFETIECLKDPDNPMDVKRALAIKEVSKTIIDSAKVEIDFIEAVGATGSDFFPNGERKTLGGAAAPRLVKG